jgi:hypothetical protein
MWSAAFSFFLFAGVGLVLPGLALLRLCRVPADIALVLPLGACVTAFLYWLSAAAGLPLLVPAGIALVGLGLFVSRPPGSVQSPGLRGALLPLSLTVGILAATVYPLHRVDAEGAFLLDGELALAADTGFHVGVTRELAIGYPPQVPGLAGFRLSYHLGVDLVRAAALRWARIDPYDSINRLDVTLWALALILAMRGAARAIGASPLAVTLAGFTVLAGDFSFVLAGNPQAHWWTDLLRGNLLLSLVYANPIVPALALTLGSLIALAHHREDPRPGWLFVAALQALAVAFFKVFLGAHLALGLGLAALLRRDRSALWAAGAAVLSTAAMVLGADASGVGVSLAPLDLVNVTRGTLALAPCHGLALVAWSLPWLFASLGLRWLGVRPAWQALRGTATPAAALAAMALVGWPLGLLFKVAPPDAVAGQRPINDASFFVEQAGPLLWIFAAIALAANAERRSRGIVVGLATLLVLPSTVHFVVKKARQDPHPLPASNVRAMEQVAAITAPGEVVLQRPGALFPPAPVILIGRRVPYEKFTPYLTQFAPRAELERRHETVHRFFHGADAAEAIAISRALGARVLCLYGRDPRLAFDVRTVYDLVYEAPGVAVYRLKEEAAGD